MRFLSQLEVHLQIALSTLRLIILDKEITIYFQDSVLQWVIDISASLVTKTGYLSLYYFGGQRKLYARTKVSCTNDYCQT